MSENKDKKDKSWYQMIGSLGGRARTAAKGFGADRTKARLAGTLGGALSRTGKKLTHKERAEVKKSLDDIVQSLNKT